MKKTMMIPFLLGGLVLISSSLTTQVTLAQTPEPPGPPTSPDCPDGPEFTLPVKVRDLEIGDCVDVMVPPRFRVQLNAHRGINAVDILMFFNDETTLRQRFDFGLELNGYVPVPNTGFSFINDFINRQRWQIDYTGSTPTCTMTILTGEFSTIDLSSPGQFQGVFKLNGRRMAVFLNRTEDLVTEVHMRVKWGRVTREPIQIIRQSEQLETQSFLNFKPRLRRGTFDPPEFCPTELP